VTDPKRDDGLEELLAELAARLGPEHGGVEELLHRTTELARVCDPDGDDPFDDELFGGPVSNEVIRLLRSAPNCTGRGPETQDYDEIVVLGAAARGIWRRLAFVDEHALRSPVLTVLAGRRPHLRAAGAGRDGDIRALLDPGGPFPPDAAWQAPASLVARRAALGADADPWDVAAGLVPDETALAFLLLDRRWPRAGSSTTTLLADGREVVGEIECGSDGSLTRGAVEGRFGTVRVLDGHPVHRANGRARPTTASTLADWLRRDPGADGPRSRRILVVSSQPHLHRVERILAELDASARLHADLEVTGCDAPHDVRPGVVLRELALHVSHRRADRARAW
jgi:hypothetical protein